MTTPPLIDHQEPDDSRPGDDRVLLTSRGVGFFVSTSLLVLGLILARDNLRIGAGWAEEGPQAGYFPFYLSLLLIGASLIGLWEGWRDRGEPKPFITQGQLRRVGQVLVPTVLFVAILQVLGLYIATLLLVGGFMRWVGRSSWRTVLLTAVPFTLILFWLFEIQFQVPMPKGPLEDWLGY